MTNRRKQIEEIAKVLNECCGFYDEKNVFLRNKCNSHDCEYWCDTNYVCCSYNDKQATALYNAGYRKIPDGAVVLTETKDFKRIEGLLTEFDEMGFLPTTTYPYPHAYASNWKLRLAWAIGELRKETAREILKELITNCQYTFNSVGKPIIALSGDFALNVSKRYGVDLEG